MPFSTGFEFYNPFDPTTKTVDIPLSDQLRTFPPGPLDVPPAEPWAEWFGNIFTGTVETITSAPGKIGDYIAAIPRKVGESIGGGVSGILSPVYPLLIMVAVIGVIAFMVLGRVNR